jgi:regulator of protease activity HflC (stomatin/prohibitin superfamily)
LPCELKPPLNFGGSVDAGFWRLLELVQLLWILVLVLVSCLLILGIVLKILPLKRSTIFEYQRGLKYSSGRYSMTLPPGQYWTLSTFTSIVPVDVRPEFITIVGQDVLSSDGVSLKVSLAAELEVADPNVARNKNANYRSALYLTLQMALRETVGKEKIDDLMQNRSAIGARLMELTGAKASEYGIKLRLADVKDIMFPGEMKKAFSQVVKAQKEGQTALERARGETAALRNLANTARLIDDNPNLLQLRALQTPTDSGGNTLVLGLPNALIQLPKKVQQQNPPPPRDDVKEE